MYCLYKSTVKKKLCMAICVLGLSYSVNGQKFYLSGKMLLDSNKIDLAMISLSKKVISSYKEENKETYLDNLFRLQNVATEYSNSIITLNSLCELYKANNLSGTNGIGFQYRIFSETKLFQKQIHSFNSAFHIIFTNFYNKLDDLEKSAAERNFDYDIGPIKNKFDYLLKKQIQVDSISLYDAINICRAYNTYNVYKQILLLGRRELKVIEKDIFIIDDSVLIKMSDGASISGIVVRLKNGDIPKPVILSFTIYPNKSDITNAKKMATMGYIGVVAYTRGKMLSLDNIEPFEHDANDGYQIIDWVSKQNWCNGKVGMIGGSYPGFSQWASLKKIHPALKTIVPQVPVGIGISFPMINGIFKSYMLNWIHYVTNNKLTDDKEFNNTKYWNSIYTKWYTSGRSFRSLDSIEGRKSEIFQRWLQHPNHDGYWQSKIPYEIDFSKIDIPILTITGYYDVGQLGSFYYFNEHYKYNKNANHFLLIGPYDHLGAQGFPKSNLMGYEIDPQAKIDINDIVFKWLDYILKDSIKPSILKDKINYEVMGTNQWKHVSSLDQINNDTLRFYFSNIRSGKYYKLLNQKPIEKGFINQEIDYNDRSDTSDLDVDKIINDIIETGENLSFISDPFNNSISINGSFIGKIKSVINKKDLDLNIELFELLPDGKFFRLSSFLGRASYVHDRRERQLLLPGKEETISFNNSWFTSKQINVGSRLVILLGVNKNKYWQVNYGTGRDVSDETNEDGKTPLKVKWLNDSYIDIPILKDR